MNRAEILEKMEPILKSEVRQIQHNDRTRVVVTPDVVTLRPGGGARTLEMSPQGVESLANFVGLPLQIASKIRPPTFGDVATQLLAQKQTYCLVLKDGVVTSLLKSTQFHPIHAERAMRAMEAGMPNLDYHRILIHDTVVTLEVVGERRQALGVGDLAQAGAQITFSPLGNINPQIRSYALVYSCTNGNTDNSVVRDFRFGGGGGDGDDIWQWFRKSTRDAYNAINKIVKRYEQLTQQEVPQGERAAILEALLKQARITGDEAAAVRAMAIENPPQNHYDMLNLITYASSHLLEEPRQVRRAQEAAATFASEESHDKVCPLCRTRRN